MNVHFSRGGGGRRLETNFIFIIKTCPKGFGLKVAKLRLKTPLKMKDNLIGTKAIAQQKWSQAIAQAKLRKAWEMFGRGSGKV